MQVDPNRRHTYQWLLRALGAYLDEQPSCRISVAETSDGFIVRMQRALHKMDPQMMHFKRKSLEAQLDMLLQQRKPAGVKVRHQGIWSNFPNGHQDFFRALGYELDQAQATSVMLDELEEGVVLTYSHSDEANGGAWQKKMVVLGVEAIEEILNAAFDRRGKPGH